MEPSSLTSHAPHSSSSFFFFPNYESHFPADAGSMGGMATSKSIMEPRRVEPEMYAYQTRQLMMMKPERLCSLKHPAEALDPSTSTINPRHAATLLILTYLFEATHLDYSLNHFSDDLAHSSRTSLSSKFVDSSNRIPLLAFLKRFWIKNS